MPSTLLLLSAPQSHYNVHAGICNYVTLFRNLHAIDRQTDKDTRTTWRC